MCLLFGSKRTDPKCLTSLTVAPCTPGPDGKTANTLAPLLPPLSSGNGRKHGGGLRSRDADDRVLSITTANCLAYLCALLCVCACVCIATRGHETRDAFRPPPLPLQKIPHRRMRYVKSLILVISMPFVLDYSSSSSSSFAFFTNR